MLEGDVQKVGIRLSNSQLWKAAEWSLHATKWVENFPSTIFMGDEYKDDKDPWSKYKWFKPEETLVQKDFDLNFTMLKM